MDKNKTAFVSGANGTVGRAIAVALRRAGYHVYGLVRSEEKAKNAHLAEEEIEIVLGDINGVSTYKDAVAKSHILVEAATMTATDSHVKKFVTLAKETGGEPKVIMWATGFMQRPFEADFLKTEGVIPIVIQPSFLWGQNGGPAWYSIFFNIKETVTIHGLRDKRWAWCHVSDFGHGVTLVAKKC